MSNTTTTVRNDATGNAVTVTFNFTFLAYASSEISVYVNDVLQTLTTHYTVAFSTSPVPSGTPSAGSITFVATPAGQASGTAPANGVTVSIIRTAPYTQAYVPTNTGALDIGGAGQTAWDELSFQTQQLTEKLARTPTLKASSTVTLGDASLPDPVADQYIGWNGTADGLTNIAAAPGSTTISLSPANALLKVNSGGTAVDTALLPIAGTGGLIWFVGTTGGTSTAYTYTPVPFPVAYAQGMVGVLRIHTTCGSAPTLNLATIGAKNLQYYTAAGVATNLASGDLVSGENYIIAYDATLDTFMVLGAVTASAFNSWLNATGNAIPQKNLLLASEWSWIGGLALTMTAGTTTMTIAKGGCADSTNAQILKSTSTFTKILHASSTWAAGSGANGGAAASVANSWYYIFALGKSTDTTAFDIGFAIFNTDLATTQAAMLAVAAVSSAGFNLARCIGVWRTDGSKNWTVGFSQGDYFFYSTPVDSSITAAANSTTGTLRTLSGATGGDVPPGKTVIALLQGMITSTAGGPVTLYVWDPALGSTRATAYSVGNAAAASQTGNAQFECRTNTAQQIYDAVGSGNMSVLDVGTLGWIDFRGKDL